mmetsp:Transcript_53311/g.141289  ORF Transcript_53311/g.141289 Transcript_53311/m.141289 type:complete len:109 (-) Transcript_53311:1121-1447(-)
MQACQRLLMMASVVSRYHLQWMAPTTSERKGIPQRAQKLVFAGEKSTSGVLSQVEEQTTRHSEGPGESLEKSWDAISSLARERQMCLSFPLIHELRPTLYKVLRDSRC